MNFQNISYFIALEKERNFTKAARNLHITQQTLSANIRALEEELGSELIIRTHPLKLTYAGKIFLNYAKDIHRKYKGLQKAFWEISRDYKGELKIGVGHTRGAILMPEIIDAFQVYYPGIEIQIKSDTNDNLAQGLIDEEIDFAIAYLPKKILGLEIKKIYEENVVMIVPKRLLEELYGDEKEKVVAEVRKTKNLRSLRDCPFLINHQEDIPWKFANNLIKKSNIEPNVKVLAENIEILFKLCIKGVGLCFSSELLINSLMPKDTMKELEVFRFGEDSEYDISLAWHESFESENLLKDFVDIVRDNVPGQCFYN